MNIINSLKQDWFLIIFYAGMACAFIGLIDGIFLVIDPIPSLIVFYVGLITMMVSGLVKIALIDLRDNCI